MNHIFLYGPSGAGKSTIGKALALELDLPFVDSDRIIEVNAGGKILEIMEAHGMPKVRDLETGTLKQIIVESESVVALGGGALLRDENRALVEENGRVVLLTGELPTLLERLQNDGNKRPLLAGDLESQLESYLESRAGHYESFPLKIRVDGKSVGQIVREIQIRLGRYHLSAMGKCDIRVRRIENLPSGDLIVTDENVAGHHLDRIKRAIGRDIPAIVIPAGEEHKNLETVHRLWKEFLRHGLDRKSMVIAFGGGVVSDLAGFAASTFMRGIDWIAIPTTLLAMVDASLGGKTGFDLPEGKNLVGAFHPPRFVLADLSFLETLPEREFRSGMAEVVKHGVIADPELFTNCKRGMDWVKENLEETVNRAMAVKIRIIEEDPYEKGIRAALNFGHTVGHALELVSGYKFRHGEAVAAGMAAEAKYAARVGLASRGTAEAIESVLSNLGLPTRIPGELSRKEIIRAMRADKKRNAAAIRFALPVEMGRVELFDVDDLEGVLEET